ncbi:MAG: ATP-dependent Clp protease proteolytic subunit, partial [Acidobacteriota bacterium]|nr:ATP-dependent Clp protease proteolytic subunit [Acidobacteriota bacterium]
MNQTWQVVLIVGVGTLFAAVVGVALLQSAALVWQTSELSDLSDGIPGLMDQFVDLEIDAGFHDPVLRRDDPLLKDRSILLNHTVNARTARDVSARLMFLNSVDDSAPIDLYISTQGGWPDSAFTIIDAMRLIDAPVNTWAVGG